MSPFRLLLITDWSLPDCVERVRDALTAGPGIAVQHRHPGASDRAFYAEGLALRAVLGDAPLFVNGRLDVALALDAHLHLTEGSLSPADVRPWLPKGRLLSASWHPPGAPRPGVDLLLLSPVFAPSSKPVDRPPLGAAAFQAFAATAPVPVFALGGLTAARVPLLKPLAGVAVVGEVLHAASPARAAAALLDSL